MDKLVKKINDTTIKIMFEENSSLDLMHSKKIQKQCLSIIEENKNCNIILDLDNLNYIDSTGIGLILLVTKHVNKNKRKISLVTKNKRFLNIFKNLAIMSIQIFKNENEAIIKMAS